MSEKEAGVRGAWGDDSVISKARGSHCCSFVGDALSPIKHPKVICHIDIIIEHITHSVIILISENDVVMNVTHFEVDGRMSEGRLKKTWDEVMKARDLTYAKLHITVELGKLPTSNKN